MLTTTIALSALLAADPAPSTPTRYIVRVPVTQTAEPSEMAPESPSPPSEPASDLCRAAVAYKAALIDEYVNGRIELERAKTGEDIATARTRIDRASAALRELYSFYWGSEAPTGQACGL